MANKSLQHSSLTDNIFYRSMLAGNDAYFPEFESDDFLEEVVLTSSAASVTFSGLGAYSDYKHLQIRAVAAQTANSYDWKMRVNGDATLGNYRSHYIWGNGSTVTSDSTNVTYFQLKQSIPRLSASGYGADVDDSFNATIVDVLDFSDTSKNTTVRTLSGFHEASSLGQGISLNSGGWFDTTAITSISFEPISGSLVAGSRFSLYGSKG